MPENWKTYKLGKVATLQRGFDLPSRKRVHGKYPIIAASGFTAWHNEYKVKGPGVITGRSGTLGQVFYEVDDFWPLNTSLWVKKFHGNHPHFIYYFLQTLNFNEFNSGTSVPTLNRNDVHSLDVTIPEIKEQKAIANILSALDDKIENNLAMNKTLEDMAMAVYKHWFVDFGPFQNGNFVDSELGPIPEGWEVKTLKDIAILGAGGDKPGEYSKEANEQYTIPIYSNGIGNEGLYGFTNKAKVTEESVTVSARGTIGFVCLREVPYVPIVRLVYIIPDTKQTTSKYIYLNLKCSNINGTGTTQQQLTVPDFSKTEIIKPPVAIVEKFTLIVARFYSSIATNKTENQKLTQLRDTLLPKLISGEVRLKEFEQQVSEVQ
ncbi:restriction endonuclease subunit S [Maribacter aurantiacus]|uniref:Type I restriction modification DNA specificity domain-containing protein n=1 Tax=Maribacter aurantiacus TaxID=1882343 RepID=A0A5R8MC12_9FLAO|nr:restriction endonuclease subunit S [Maribacter aurantiacus]TLF47112.1 hypothetical protein FEK29_04930 [Maribacter aurantiacus]